MRLTETDAAVLFELLLHGEGDWGRGDSSLDLPFRDPEGLEKSQDSTMARMESVEWGVVSWVCV